MKRIFFSFIVWFLLALAACNDNRLDIAPLNILTADQVLQNESAITAYMASLYNALPMEDHLFFAGGNGNRLANNTDEAISCFTDERNGIGDGTWTSWWGYSHVRNVNDLIEKLPQASLNEENKQRLLGEAYFIRAYYYFAMVKRYGGVPIIKNVQYFTGDNIAELQVPRNREAEVYDFIASDLDSAALLLEENNLSGRATRQASLALKSRAMLYAASSAQYGNVQLDGIIGIPASRADEYWEAAYQAAEAVITSETHALYNKAPDDKVRNFQDLFLDEENNPEVILARHYSYPDKTHGYDNWVLPFGVRGPDGYSSRMCPTLELVEQFEYVDGSSGELKIEDAGGNPIFYEHPTDLFKDKDPRCLATVIVPFSTFQGAVIDVQARIYYKGKKFEAGDYSQLYNPETHQSDNKNGPLHIVGLSGLRGSEKTQTGFYTQKYLDTTLPRSRTTYAGSEQQWIDLRYGEVLLNYAEAAAELGRIEDAKWALNEIRARAGIKLLESNQVNVEKVRHERLVELAFENHRWWDYRRWRVSDNIFNNTRFSMLKPYYDLDQNAYRFERGVAGRFPKTFNVRVYYE